MLMVTYYAKFTWRDKYGWTPVGRGASMEAAFIDLFEWSATHGLKWSLENAASIHEIRTEGCPPIIVNKFDQLKILTL